jgi:GNAT superfamily N-acetyltransferase
VRVVIRDATLTDIGVLRDVFRRSSLTNEGDRLSLLANPDALELSDVAVREGRTRVATVKDDRIVGFASTVIIGSALELDDLFVDPDWMRQGIARELVLDTVAVARNHALGRVEVTANRHALRFYESVGFVRDGDVETRFGSGLRMHLVVAVDR